MNNKKSIKLFLITTMISLLSTSVVFAEELDVSVRNADHYGILTLIPPILAILLAFITKNVVISLFIGALSGTF